MDNLVRDPVVIRTKLGAFRVQFSPRGLTRLEFCKAGSIQQQAASLPYNLKRQLQRYAAGQLVRWKVPVDLSSGTEFQQKVWRVLTTIPHGETRSYGWVAQRVGKPKASRAVGAACGANPVPVIVPCHRVIAGDGSIGGFGGGLPLKRRLLMLEKNH
jgi:methylated-DNA-[protein]-cysteine S-methyltransferase